MLVETLGPGNISTVPLKQNSTSMNLEHIVLKFALVEFVLEEFILTSVTKKRIPSAVVY